MDRNGWARWTGISGHDGPKYPLRHPAFWKLAIAFAANMFIFSALSVHLIPLLNDLGHAAGVAVMMSTLIGPMQVAGRICERTFARNALPQTVGLFSFASLPAAVLTLLLWGSQWWAAAAFCILYGLSNGILTIVRGTIPQAMFGRLNYGAISGAMAGPSLLAKAAGPLVAAFVLQAYPAPAVLIAMLLVLALVPHYRGDEITAENLRRRALGGRMQIRLGPQGNRQRFATKHPFKKT